VLAVISLAVAVTGCSRAATGAGGTTMTTTQPAGPAATLSGPVTTGKIIEPLSVPVIGLAAHGYVEQEFFASGTASSYEGVGTLGRDGRWTVKVDGSAPYRTRIVVRRPADPARFNGTVAVEWLNVSSGLEAAPDWAYAGDELVRAGYAYVAVSAQALGVVGGRALLSVPGGGPSGGLRSQEPARYGTLEHPGDQYAYDIFTQVARALRVPEDVRVLGGLHPRHILALGESQSAFFLTTYADAVQPGTHAFDGFFIHSRSGGAALLGAGPAPPGPEQGGVEIRTDLDVPVFVLETETDLGPLLDYGPARQPNTSRFRAWEVAGTAHADAFIVGPAAGLLGCQGMVNAGPAHYVVEAALAALTRWVSDGTPPPVAARLALSSTSPPTVARDALGNAVGGVRTPAVDAPVAALSGVAPPGSNVLCTLFGSTVPFDAATLVRLYHDKAGYLRAFGHALDKAVDGGFVLGADRPALLAQAQEVQFP